MQTFGFASWILHQTVPSSARKKSGQCRIFQPFIEIQ